MKKQFLLLWLLHLTSTLCSQIDGIESIDSLFNEWNMPETPGGAIGIVHNGQIIYSKGYGMADLEHNIEISPSSVFYIGSVSKQFVTFSILLLEERGVIDLDHKIQEYLPDFPEYNSQLTVRNFIHHTSGIRDYLTLMYLKGRNYLDGFDENEVYELIKKQRELNFAPGEKYLYSNSCYFMLALLIEKVSGQSLKDFAYEHIFQPLGMKNSLFYDHNTDLIKNRVFSYEKKINKEGFNNLIMRFDLVGSGGMYSTVEDLYLWDQNFYNNRLGKGGQQIIDKMHEEGLLNNGKSSGYAFALNKGTYKGLRTVSHSGSLAGYRAQFIRFPDEKFSVIILANRGDANPTDKSLQIADFFLKDKFAERLNRKIIQKNDSSKVGFVEEFENKQLAGTYQIQVGFSLECSLENEVLQVIQTWNRLSYSLSKTIGNTYEVPKNTSNTSIQFVFSDLKDGFAQKLTILQNGNRTIARRKMKIDPGTLNLNEYSGRYYSDALDVSYEIIHENGKLSMQITSYDPKELIVNGNDSFTTDLGLIRFQRFNDKITGFELDAGRVTHLKFEKR